LVDIEVGKYANFLKGDIQLLPLNDIVEPELDNIIKARVDIYSKDNNYYGICFHAGAAVIFYNTELCDKAGIDWKNIKTWDEYYEAGKKLKAAEPTKYWESVESTDIWHMWPLLAELGGDMTAADGSITIDTPDMAKVLEFNRKLIDEGLAVVAPGGYHHAEEFYAMMNNGEIGSIVMPMCILTVSQNYSLT
jgi:arabinosaccharide transport system substrate-binding protein